MYRGEEKNKMNFKVFFKKIISLKKMVNAITKENLNDQIVISNFF